MLAPPFTWMRLPVVWKLQLHRAVVHDALSFIQDKALSDVLDLAFVTKKAPLTSISLNHLPYRSAAYGAGTRPCSCGSAPGRTREDGKLEGGGSGSRARTRASPGGLSEPFEVSIHAPWKDVTWKCRIRLADCQFQFTRP